MIQLCYMRTSQGGILWFTDLTVPVQGALGALFPVLVAATYFTNLQVLFYIISGRLFSMNGHASVASV